MDISVSSSIFSPHTSNVLEKIKNISRGKFPKILTCFQYYPAFNKNSNIEHLNVSHPLAN